MDKPTYRELEARIAQLERAEALLREKQDLLSAQNIKLVRRSIELSDLKREMEDKNHELELLAGQLEERVRQRTDELSKANEELRKQIAERLRMEEALRESEQRHRAFLEASPDPIVVYGLEGEVIYLNQAFSRVYGWQLGELLGKKIDFVPPDKWGEARDQIDKTLGGQTVSGLETQRRAKGGSLLEVAVSAAPLYDHQGRITGLIVMHRDITDRKRAEEALRESEQRYHGILEASPDPIVLYDMEGRVLYINPAFTRVFGWTLEELAGRRTDFVPEWTWPETSKRVEQVKRGESFLGFETQRYNKRQEIVEVSLSGAVWRDRLGRPAGAVINLRDITEQKRMEAQLRQAQKMEAVGILAGGIAHDFNNVLQSISGYIQLFSLRGKAADADPRYLAEADRSIQRGAELVRQLLTFSRKTESHKRPVDLAREVRRACHLLGRTLPKMIDIQTSLEENLWLVSADPTQVEQVLLNLSFNASQAMPEGGRLLIEAKNVSLDEDYCRHYAELRPGCYVQLTVSDTGCGMDQATLEHIFEPFFTTKEVGKGTGLGLSIVYGIVKGHGGHITCYSQPGLGTTFKILLPTVTEATPQTLEPSLEEKMLGGSETILLVDDEPAILQVGRELLEQLGYRALTADSGEEALEIFRQRPGEVDLVILDLGMPGMGGRRCLQEIRGLRPDQKVIIASGYSAEGQVKEIMKLGADGFISKPYRFQDMLTRVRQALDRRPEEA